MAHSPKNVVVLRINCRRNGTCGVAIEQQHLVCNMKAFFHANFFVLQHPASSLCTYFCGCSKWLDSFSFCLTSLHLTFIALGWNFILALFARTAFLSPALIMCSQVARTHLHPPQTSPLQTHICSFNNGKNNRATIASTTRFVYQNYSLTQPHGSSSSCYVCSPSMRKWLLATWSV